MVEVKRDLEDKIFRFFWKLFFQRDSIFQVLTEPCHQQNLQRKIRSPFQSITILGIPIGVNQRDLLHRHGGHDIGITGHRTIKTLFAPVFLVKKIRKIIFSECCQSKIAFSSYYSLVIILSSFHHYRVISLWFL